MHICCNFVSILLITDINLLLVNLFKQKMDEYQIVLNRGKRIIYFSIKLRIYEMKPKDCNKQNGQWSEDRKSWCKDADEDWEYEFDGFVLSIKNSS